MEEKYKKMYEKAYKLPFTLWSDKRIPPEVVRLAGIAGKKSKAIDIGCGVGNFSIYFAQQGIKVTGIDFAPTAILKAQKKAAGCGVMPDFIVQDITNLNISDGPFDIALDVGCFHCQNANDQQLYAANLAPLMKKGSTLLIWSMDSPPPGARSLKDPTVIRETFGSWFILDKVETSRRRFAKSKWYWLVRK